MVDFPDQTLDVNLPNKRKEVRLLIWWPERLGTHESLHVGLGRRCVLVSDVRSHDITVWIRVCTRAGPGHLLQHNPVTQVARMIFATWVNIHDMVSQLLEQCTLQQFSKEICDHLCHWAVFNFDMLQVNLVLNKEVANIHVAHSFGTGLLAILFNENQTHVILIENDAFDVETLCSQEVSITNQLRHDIMHCHNFRLGRALCNMFLLAGHTV